MKFLLMLAARVLERMAKGEVHTEAPAPPPVDMEPRFTVLPNGSMVGGSPVVRVEMHPVVGGWVWSASTGCLSRARFHRERDEAVKALSATAADFESYARQ